MNTHLFICNQLHYQLEPRVALESAQMKAQIAVKMKLATHKPILGSNVGIIVKKSESCYLFFHFEAHQLLSICNFRKLRMEYTGGTLLPSRNKDDSVHFVIL